MTVVTDEGTPFSAGFPATTRAQWRRLAARVLRAAGAGDVAESEVEEALSTRLPDGITARPLYTAADDAPGGDVGLPGFAPYVRGARAEGSAPAGWDVRQRHADGDAARVNEAILTDLENGATSIWLSVGPGAVPVADLGTALGGVDLSLAPVALEPGAEFAAAAEAMLNLCRGYQARGRSAPVPAVLGADPLGVLARAGRGAGADTGGDVAAAAALAARCHRHHPGVRALVVDALPYHEAGGSDAQELGCSLATGVAYLRATTAAGLPVDAACGQLEFRYAATTDLFLTIAKLRAARRLWARVTEVCGATPPARAQRQHAVTSRVMMSRLAPWVNMPRTTVACLGAGVGGADVVTVLPFDGAPPGRAGAFGRRIARNTSSILIAEANVARVIDPAGGSWYVERLTAELSEAAWAWFQEVERAGGHQAALRSGLVAERLAATWEGRRRDLALRREPITGVSEFANLDERPTARPEARLEADEPGGGGPPGGGGLPRVRREDAYAALWARAAEWEAAHGARPAVFLVALGPAAAHSARLSFAANLFRAGGVVPLQGEDRESESGSGSSSGSESGVADVADVAAAFARSGAAVACLCGPDAAYAEEAEAVTAALRDAGARRVLLAGRPARRPAGVDEFIFQGGDAVAALSAVLDATRGDA